MFPSERQNPLAVAEFLRERDPDLTDLVVNGCLLDIARDRSNAEMEKLLEAKLATPHNVSPNGQAVAETIRQHDAAAMRRLLEASPDLLHAGDQRSNQPIHRAVMTRQLEIMDELPARGADIDARRSDGARPVQLTNGNYHYRGWDQVPKDTVPTRTWK